MKNYFDKFFLSNFRFFLQSIFRPRKKKSRWTEEVPEIQVGKMLSGPAEAPEPVAKFSSDGKKLTKAQRKKLKKKRRKEQRKNDDSGVETDQSDSNKKERVLINVIELLCTISFFSQI